MGRQFQSIEINLLPARSIPFLRLYRPYVIVVALFCLIIIAMIVVAFISNRLADNNARVIEQYDIEINALQVKISEMNTLASVSEYLSLPETTRSAQASLADVHAALEAHLVPGMNVLSIEVKQAKRIEMTAYFGSVEVLLSFLDSIRQDPQFRVVTSNGYTNIPTSTGSSTARLLPVTQVTFQLEYSPEGQKGDAP